jgi:hypothetical protein
MRLTPNEDAALPHPSQATMSRHGIDVLLRLHKFEIASRPKHGEPSWRQGVFAERGVGTGAPGGEAK